MPQPFTCVIATESVSGGRISYKSPSRRLPVKQRVLIMQETTIARPTMPVRPPSFARDRPMRTADDLARRTPKIDVAHLNFYYGAKQALSDISLSIPQNCVTALIGPSGCGK